MSTFSKPEIQLFLLYSNARKKENELIAKIQEQFEILEIYEVEWEKKNFKLNLERFYCENLRKKIKDSGDGKFLVITVRDEEPVYKFEQTLRRFELVNSKVLNMKKELRKITSSPKKLRFRVHATDNTYEVDNNLMFILGKSYDEYYDYAINKTFDGNYIKFKQEPVGTNGWLNINEVFRLLNSYVKYICFEDINEKTSEINILADDYICVNYLLNGKNAYNNKFSKSFMLEIGTKTYRFNIVTSTDKYFCEKLCSDLLKNRTLSDRGYYVPQKQDLPYIILYQKFVHKKELSLLESDVIKKNENLSKYIFEKNSDDYLLEQLYEYLYKNDYYVQKPSNNNAICSIVDLERVKWKKLFENKYGFKNIETRFCDNENHCYYFSGEYLGKKVFIKCSDGDLYAKKEYEIREYLNEQNSVYFPKNVMYRLLEDKKMFNVTEFIDGQKLSEVLLESSDSNIREKIFNSICEIADILYRNNIIHRDINFDNFIVEKDGTTKLLGFKNFIGLDYSEAYENLIDIKKIKSLNKKMQPRQYVWDDMFAFFEILIKFEKYGISDFNEKIKDIKSKIGKHRYYFYYNKFPLSSYLKFKTLVLHKTINAIAKPFRKLFRHK